MPIVRFDEVTCLADWAAGQRQARTAGRAGAGQCAAGGGEGMGRSKPWGLVRGAPWPPPAVRRTLSLSSLICRRGAVRVFRLEVLRLGRAGLPPGMPPGSEGLGPRCWWRPLPSPAARPPLDLGRRQHLAAPPGDGGPTRGRGPCRHRRRPRHTPSSLALPRGRAGQASGEDGPRGGRAARPLPSRLSVPSCAVGGRRLPLHEKRWWLRGADARQ